MACINCEREVAPSTTHVYFSTGVCEVKEYDKESYFVRRPSFGQSPFEIVTDEEAKTLLDSLTRYFREPVLPVSRYCQALRIWGQIAERRGIIGKGVVEDVQLGITKSNLLARLIYGGDAGLRIFPCPLHEGQWSGIPHPDHECPHGCELTGWLPEPMIELNDQEGIYQAVMELHHRDQDKPAPATSMEATWPSPMPPAIFKALLLKQQRPKMEEKQMTATATEKPTQYPFMPETDGLHEASKHVHVPGGNALDTCEGCRQEKEIGRLVGLGIDLRPPLKMTFENLTDTVEEWTKRVHQVNLAKGWWHMGVRERNIPEVLLLVRSELVEAHEEYRNPDSELKKIYFGKGRKPEGIPIELADVVIRILDIVGALSKEYEITFPTTWTAESLPEVATNFGEAMDDVQMTISRARRCWNEYAPSDRRMAATFLVYNVLLTLYHTFKIARHHDIDLGEAVIMKWKYNATRPIRHGGKRA